MSRTLVASTLLGVFPLGLFARLILRGHQSEVKVNLQTTPGRSLPVLVNHDATVRTLELEVPKSAALTEPNKLPKGEDGLQDAIKIPTELINIYVKSGPKTHAKKISSHVTVRQLKEELVEAGVVYFSTDEFKLCRVEKENDDVNKTVLIDDDSHQLYYYGVRNETNLTVIGPYIRLNIVDTEGKKSSRIFSRWSSLQEVKTTLVSVRHFDFLMFVKHENEVYRKLDTAYDILLDHVLAHGDTIYLSKIDFFVTDCPVHFKGFEMDKVGFGKESILSIKLRTQLLTGVPVRNINIMSRPPGSPAEYNHNSAADTPSANSFNNVGQNTYRNGDQNINVAQNTYGNVFQYGSPTAPGNQMNYMPYRYSDNRILSGGAACYIDIV